MSQMTISIVSLKNSMMILNIDNDSLVAHRIELFFFLPQEKKARITRIAKKEFRKKVKFLLMKRERGF